MQQGDVLAAEVVGDGGLAADVEPDPAPGLVPDQRAEHGEVRQRVDGVHRAIARERQQHVRDVEVGLGREHEDAVAEELGEHVPLRDVPLRLDELVELRGRADAGVQAQVLADLTAGVGEAVGGAGAAGSARRLRRPPRRARARGTAGDRRRTPRRRRPSRPRRSPGRRAGRRGRARPARARLAGTPRPRSSARRSRSRNRRSLHPGSRRRCAGRGRRASRRRARLGRRRPRWGRCTAAPAPTPRAAPPRDGSRASICSAESSSEPSSSHHSR